jgi:4-hydroxythreonine-4-phosphate dehydrogenase
VTAPQVLLPRIIVTSGEPAGIGPDICLELARRDWPCQLVIAGDPELLSARTRLLGIRLALELHEPSSPPLAQRAGSLRVAAVPLLEPCTPGRLDPANARYVLALIDRAVAGCSRGEFDAMVTAPVQKSVINDAGIPFTGHTEYLAQLTGARLPVMMLVAGQLRVALATTHLPLARVPASLGIDGLVNVMTVLDADLRQRFALDHPRIRVCGLNPHAGEGGHLGREDIEIIAPAVSTARQKGIEASGPVPADTAFTPSQLASADVVLAMYHDQGLPVLKFAGFGSAVNITLGLPIIRTSVDHGTALDLAGTGKADAGSLIAAVEQAMAIARTARR